MAKDLVTQIRDSLTYRRIVRHFPDAEDPRHPKGDQEWFELMRDQGLRRVAGHGHFDVRDIDITPTAESTRPLSFEILHTALSRDPMKILTLAQGSTQQRISYKETSVDWDVTDPAKTTWWIPRHDRISLVGLGLSDTDVCYWGVPIEDDVIEHTEWERGAVAASLSLIWEEIAARITRDGEFSMPGLPVIRGNTSKAMAVADAYVRQMARAVI